MVLDNVEISCTQEYDGRPLVTNSWDDRIVWESAPNQIDRVQRVQVRVRINSGPEVEGYRSWPRILRTQSKLIFNGATDTEHASIADLKIFYRKSGRYRSLNIDNWVDGTCLTKPNFDHLTGIQSGSQAGPFGNGLTIEKGKQYCFKQGFAYACLKESSSNNLAGTTNVKCENTRLGLLLLQVIYDMKFMSNQAMAKTLL